MSIPPATLSLQFSGEDVPSYDACFTTLVESLRTIAARLPEYDVDLTVENNVVERDNVVDSTSLLMFARKAEFDALFEEIDPETIGVLLDTGHLKLNATTFGFEYDQFVRHLSPYVDALHLHTNDGTTDSHDSLAPGELRNIRYKSVGDGSNNN